MKTRAREGGFTLVEIAIVLVIIGLLLGGILKGQELITSARVRNLADQGAAVQAAYYGFVDRYHAIPGDMPTTDVCGAIGNVWASCGSGNGPGGNGDGNINNNVWEEASALWAHLSGAGFLQGAYQGGANSSGAYIGPPALAPKNPWEGLLLLGRTSNYLTLTPGPTPARLHLIIGNNIPVNVMRELDVKIDDSAPASGVLRAPVTNPTVFSPVGANTAAEPTCVSTVGGQQIWDINGASVGCNGYYLF